MVLADTFVSISMAYIILSFAELSGISHIGSGPNMLFKVLPAMFIKLGSPTLLTAIFFTLVTFATITSQISVVEPAKCFVKTKFGLTDKWALTIVVIISFLVGAPLALSVNKWSLLRVGTTPLLFVFDNICVKFFIPLGHSYPVFLYCKTNCSINWLMIPLHIFKHAT